MLPNPRLTVSISRLFLGMNFPFPRLISDETATNGKLAGTLPAPSSPSDKTTRKELLEAQEGGKHRTLVKVIFFDFFDSADFFRTF